jgi:phosphonate transport system ATP-binding protein
MRVDPHLQRRPAALGVENLCVTRGGRAALSDVTTEFDHGAVTAIVGPSGAGKTTLIHVLNGLIAPTRGIVRSDARGPLVDAPGWARQRARTATVFQDHALIGRLSALDNVLLGLADRRSPLAFWPWPRSARRRAARALADVGLLSRALDRVDRFSGGEKQRIGVARALAREPMILLGDEPFAALDPPRARDLGADLRRLATRDGVAVVLVLHQIALARALADRIVGLNEGRLRFDGPTVMFDDEAEARVFG